MILGGFPIGSVPIAGQPALPTFTVALKTTVSIDLRQTQKLAATAPIDGRVLSILKGLINVDYRIPVSLSRGLTLEIKQTIKQNSSYPVGGEQTIVGNPSLPLDARIFLSTQKTVASDYHIGLISTSRQTPVGYGKGLAYPNRVTFDYHLELGIKIGQQVDYRQYLLTGRRFSFDNRILLRSASTVPSDSKSSLNKLANLRVDYRVFVDSEERLAIDNRLFVDREGRLVIDNRIFVADKFSIPFSFGQGVVGNAVTRLMETPLDFLKGIRKTGSESVAYSDFLTKIASLHLDNRVPFFGEPSSYAIEFLKGIEKEVGLSVSYAQLIRKYGLLQVDNHKPMGSMFGRTVIEFLRTVSSPSQQEVQFLKGLRVNSYQAVSNSVFLEKLMRLQIDNRIPFFGEPASYEIVFLKGISRSLRTPLSPSAIALRKLLEMIGISSGFVEAIARLEMEIKLGGIANEVTNPIAVLSRARRSANIPIYFPYKVIVPIDLFNSGFSVDKQVSSFGF